VPARGNRPHGEREVEAVDAPDSGGDAFPEALGEYLVEEREVERAAVVGDDRLSLVDVGEEVVEHVVEFVAEGLDLLTQAGLDDPGSELGSQAHEAVERRGRGRPGGVRPEADGTNLEDRALSVGAGRGVA
jgi:hypothetical protein